MKPSPSLQEIIQFLSRPDSYKAESESVAIVQTHISVVALTDRYVYKLKKPVRFDFLDFSTLEKRRFYCQQEIQLNQRLAPRLYCGILPLYWDGQTLSFQSVGPIVDYVIQMHRLTQEGLLVNQVKNPQVEKCQLEALVVHLRTFYQAAQFSPELAVFATADAIRATLQEVTACFSEFTRQTLSPFAACWLPSYFSAFMRHNPGLFAARIQAGKIVEGHGDLRLEHIHLAQNTITIFDCIEFSPRLRCLDWLNDLAFLLMDLEYRHCQDGALYLQTRLVSNLENEDVTPLLNFYKTYRACVRGKVDSMKALEPEVEPQVRQESVQKARAYYQLALRYALLGSEPTLLVCMGGVATGKSTMAAALSTECGVVAYHSDVIRKERMGVNLLKRLPDDQRSPLYETSVTDAVYQELLDRGLQEVHQSGAVILDATYRNQEYLDHVQEVCRKHAVRLLVIQTEAARELIEQRLKQREVTPSVSDLRLSDYVPSQFSLTYPIEQFIDHGLKVDTAQPVAAVLNQQVFPWLIHLSHRLDPEPDDDFC